VGRPPSLWTGQSQTLWDSPPVPRSRTSPVRKSQLCSCYHFFPGVGILGGFCPPLGGWIPAPALSVLNLDERCCLSASGKSSFHGELVPGLLRDLQGHAGVDLQGRPEEWTPSASYGQGKEPRCSEGHDGEIRVGNNTAPFLSLWPRLVSVQLGQPLMSRGLCPGSWSGWLLSQLPSLLGESSQLICGSSCPRHSSGLGFSHSTQL
jgi:hypothetical protein